MTLQFQEIPTPYDARRDQFLRGGTAVRRFIAELGGGELLRVMLAAEPAGKRGAMLAHLSCSVGINNQCAPTRRPTDGELRAAAETFGPLVVWEETPAEHDHRVRHLWQSEKEDA